MSAAAPAPPDRRQQAFEDYGKVLIADPGKDRD